MEIELDTYYKTRNGRKAFVVYMHDGLYLGHIENEHRNIIAKVEWESRGSVATSGNPCNDSYDLVALWEDEPEEIEVSEMYAPIRRIFDGGMFSNNYIPHSNLDKLRQNISGDISNTIIAILTVKEWQEIQQGKRKLIVGKGL